MNCQKVLHERGVEDFDDEHDVEVFGGAELELQGGKPLVAGRPADEHEGRGEVLAEDFESFYHGSVSRSCWLSFCTRSSGDWRRLR